MSEPAALGPLPFSDLEGWAGDDHVPAFAAFLRSCRKAPQDDPAGGDPALAAALGLGEGVDGETARAFFERHFEPQRPLSKSGFVTGYYEPELRGSRNQSARFPVPVYARPDDLICNVPDSERARFNHARTGFRAAPHGVAPYYTRAEIDAGALADRGCELLYVEDAVELFYMQVQGSGLVHLDDGSDVRLAYAGKNGHPYTSIARVLIERNELKAAQIDMDTVKSWLRAEKARGAALMHENESYIFFREAPGLEGPVGAEGVTLSAGRSLAVDTAFHALGTPVFVSAPDLPGGVPFRRLMIAQDVGSAIAGVQRGDIFFGTGEAAGAIAGRTRHAAAFHVLLPKR